MDAGVLHLHKIGEKSALTKPSSAHPKLTKRWPGLKMETNPPHTGERGSPQDLDRTLVINEVEIGELAYRKAQMSEVLSELRRGLFQLKSGKGTTEAEEPVEEEEEDQGMKSLQLPESGFHKLEAEIIASLPKYKSLYVDEIEEVLNKNPGWLTTEALRQRHDKLLAETMQWFEAEMAPKIRRELEVHVGSLQREIDGYWDTALETNNQNVQRRRDQDKKELEEIERKSIEDMRQRGDRTRASEKKKLPPLVFQLQKTRIKMGMIVRGETKVLINASWKDSTPFIVGLNMDGELIYGSKVVSSIPPEGSSKESSLRGHWWVADHFIASEDEPWSEEIRLGDGTCHKISVEFLLAFIMKKLKEHVEGELNGECSAALIIVPFWFCIAQRIQVKDGAKLVGFSEVKLISEPAAAAFTTEFNDEVLSPEDTILVITENGERIDASVYAYKTVGDSSRLTMVGYYGSIYEENNRLRRLATGASAMIGAISAQFGEDEDSNPDSRGKLQIVRRACKKARALACLSPSSKSQFVVVNFESDEWGPILKQVGMEHALNLWGNDVGNAAVLGAAFLSKYYSYIYYKVQDKLAFSVRCSGGTASHECVFSKKDLLPKPNSVAYEFSHFTSAELLGFRQGDAIFPELFGKGEIYQRVAGYNIRVGAVELICEIFRGEQLEKHTKLEVNLDICNEGIVALKEVVYVGRHDYRDHLRDDEYEWITPNLTPKDMARLQKCLKSLPLPGKGKK